MNPCKIMETSTVAPGSMILALGRTQYNLGAVVLTLYANGVSVVLVNLRYCVVGWVNEPRALVACQKMKIGQAHKTVRHGRSTSREA